MFYNNKLGNCQWPCREAPQHYEELNCTGFKTGQGQCCDVA